MSLRDDMRRILEAGAVEASGVAHPVQRDRTSPAGQVAARTVRQLSILLGNALTAEMVELGFGPLLAFLASPRWLQWTTWSGSEGQRGSNLARAARGDTLPEDFDAWAQPVGLEGGDDSTLRGVPGGGARAAVRLYLDTARTAAASSPIYQSWAYRTLTEASTAFSRPANAMINLIEGIAESGRVRNQAQARQAVRVAYWEELNYLGRQNAPHLNGAAVKVIAAEVPGPVVLGGFDRVDVSDALRVRPPGLTFRPSPSLGSQAPGTRSEGEAPVDDAAPAESPPVEGAQTVNPKKKRPAWVVPVVIAAITTIGGAVINKLRS